MKILAAIKKLFSRKKKDRPIAYLKFEVDSAGDIWIDAAWQDQPAANIVFADLMYRVMDGDLFAETLSFLKEECEKRDRVDSFIEVWAYLHTLGQGDQEDNLQPEAAGVVISPTQMLDSYKPKLLPGSEHLT